MKCKAKWIKSMQTWQLYCPEHECYIVLSGDNVTPMDLVNAHVEREHKGE